MKNHTWSARVEEDVNTGDYYLQLPDTLLEDMGWRVGDEINWLDNHDGSYTMSKKNTQWVLVETVGMFRHRYLVEVPDGKAEWALDTVAMEEAKEFSQEHLGETITSHRIVPEAEALLLCDEDNDYCASWSEKKKKEEFFTSIDDLSQKKNSLSTKDVDVPPE